MHKLESVLWNETDKILWEIQTQTDHRIPTRKPEPELIN